MLPPGRECAKYVLGSMFYPLDQGKNSSVKQTNKQTQIKQHNNNNKRESVRVLRERMFSKQK